MRRLPPGPPLAQQMSEIAVAQPVERVGSLPQRAKQLHPLAESFQHMLRLQRARLVEGGGAALGGREIIEIDQKIVPALLARG